MAESNVTVFNKLVVLYNVKIIRKLLGTKFLFDIFFILLYCSSLLFSIIYFYNVKNMKVQIWLDTIPDNIHGKVDCRLRTKHRSAVFCPFYE